MKNDIFTLKRIMSYWARLQFLWCGYNKYKEKEIICTVFWIYSWKLWEKMEGVGLKEEEKNTYFLPESHQSILFLFVQTMSDVRSFLLSSITRLKNDQKTSSFNLQQGKKWLFFLIMKGLIIWLLLHWYIPLLKRDLRGATRGWSFCEEAAF